MRNTNSLLVLLAIVFIFSACSGDDDNSSSINDSKLIGLWHSEPSADPEMTIEFTNSHRTHFTYHDFGNNGQDITESGDWELNGSNLKIYWDEADEGLEIYNLDIIELTDSTLKWRVNIDGNDYIEVYNR